MKTVFLLFDSLNLRMLNSYGGNYFETSNFNRLAKNAETATSLAAFSTGGKTAPPRKAA